MPRNKVLIVDDDKDFLSLLNAQLTESGYQVAFASDVPSALMMTRKESPQVILLDIGLPGGDGFMVMDRLRAIDAVAHIPIIVLTAKDPSITRERALKTGARAYFQKPVDKTVLLAEIRKALGETRKNGETQGSNEVPPSTANKILIVDDDKDFLQLLNVRLKNNGYQVVFSRDVPSALGMVRKEKPDLILLDIGLPGGDGFVLMERLRAIDRIAHIPIVVVTAQSGTSAKERALKAGARAFFQKPVDNNQLLVTIREALGDSSNPSNGENLGDVYGSQSSHP